MNKDFCVDAHAYIFSVQRVLVHSKLRVGESWIVEALRSRQQQPVEPAKSSGLSVNSDECSFESSFLGLFCCGNKIAKDEVICRYYGCALRTTAALRLADKAYLMRLGEQSYVDSREYRHCFARYINDCRNPAGYNATFVKYPSHPEHGPCALVVASRAINVGEEIFVNYGPRYWSSVPDAVWLTFKELHFFRGPIE